MKTHNPGQAGFMNRDEKLEEEEGVEVAAISGRDAKYLAEDEEYSVVDEAVVEDDQESWYLLSIRD